MFRLLEKRRAEGLDESAEAVADEGAGALEYIERQETIAEVRRAVVSLPSQYREAVVLCDLEGASYDGAASIIGCPVGTVRSRLSRGRELLALKLKAGRAGALRESGVARSAP